MNILILEDEKPAATRLCEQLKHVEPGGHIVAILETVKEAVAWFASAPLAFRPDLILSDIQLADGLSLDLFKLVNINAPVIFTTAYDAYTLKAFKLNSVDYLLKPIDREELENALEKYRSLYQSTTINKKMLDLMQSFGTTKPTYKSRFLVRLGERLITIPTAEVAYVRADDKVVFLHTTNGQKHIIDDSLDELDTALDPATFFRINRTYIAPLGSIEKIHNHFNGRLKIGLRHADDNEIFVSRARAISFKKWLGK